MKLQHAHLAIIAVLVLSLGLGGLTGCGTKYMIVKDGQEVEASPAEVAAATYKKMTEKYKDLRVVYLTAWADARKPYDKIKDDPAVSQEVKDNARLKAREVQNWLGENIGKPLNHAGDILASLNGVIKLWLVGTDQTETWEKKLAEFESIVAQVGVDFTRLALKLL